MSAPSLSKSKISARTKFIIGLGNPGPEYQNTRHNAGFMALDTIRVSWNFPEWKTDEKNEAVLTQARIDGKKVFLIKPLAFMNLSGRAISKILSYYKGSASDILVIHDELDLPQGEIRAAFGRGSAGHRGVQSIMDALDTRQFARLRIGIGKNGVKGNAEKYVLGRFSRKELAALEAALIKTAVKAKEFAGA